MTDYAYPNEPLRFSPSHIDDVLAFCTQNSASDITFQTGEPIFAEINGRLYRLTKRKLSNGEVGDLLNSIYGPNGTTQILSGSDVDTHYEFRPSRGTRFRFRVNGTGCQVEGHPGLQLTLRTIPTYPPSLTSMNLPAPVLAAIAPEDGVVYVTGATGSGKSTLLASIIKEIAEDPNSHRKILTYESPIEFVYDAIEKPTAIVSQSEVPRHLPSFAAGVRNALRRKPRLILVGEARDSETISAVLEAALTGHPVYTTLHSNGVAEVVRRLVGTFPGDEREGRAIDILETIRLIIWQKLVPTVDGKRVALREYLVFDEDVRDELLSIELEQITMAVRRLVKQKGQTMLTDAEQKFQEGIISERQYQILRRGADIIE
jgi:defect-in-organelle-trafficking protein DotB